MSAKTPKKTISKLYPPQLSQSHSQLYLYCPLEHWIEVYSGTSLTDVLQIQGGAQPLYMNHCFDNIVLQDDKSVWLRDEESQFREGFAKRWTSQQSIVSGTIKLQDAYINITSKGQLNCWKPSNIKECNPESAYTISTKGTISEDQQELLSIEADLDVETMVRKYNCGYNLVNFTSNNDHNLLTLHKFEEEGEQWTRICSTQIEDGQCESHFYRGTMPETITSLTAHNNNVLAYGGKDLFIVDRRCEQIVATLNDLPDSNINSVKISHQRPYSLTVCRNNVVLKQDVRRPGEIVEVLMALDEDIDSYEQFDSQLVVCGKFTGKVTFHDRKKKH